MFGKITEINTRYFKLPLEGNLVDAIHGKHNFFEIITAEVILDSGVKRGGIYIYRRNWRSRGSGYGRKGFKTVSAGQGDGTS